MHTQNPKHLDELIQQLLDALPAGLRTLPQDIEKNFRAILQAGFARLDLITRDEFDAQVAVLERTRKKLEALTKELHTLEERLKKEFP